ncbi:MAG: hypothetical protein GX444_13405 [Myxococcales bacterium]|nr:hypothetical protein [Myxococcales bacterium]
MNIEITHFLLLVYKAFGNSINGKTVLQKRVYFLGHKLGINLGYKPHYYGPYSPIIENTNSTLKALGYIEEKISGAGLDPSGFEMARHDFSLTTMGQSVSEMLASQRTEEWTRIQTAAKDIETKSSGLNYLDLSIAAKAYFLCLNKGESITFDEIKKVGKDYGWTIKQQDLEKAASFLRNLNLVQ